MKKYKVYLFRHGKTNYNEEGRFTGWQDSKLIKEGVENAKKIADILKNVDFKFAFHTSLSRSIDTLSYVLKGHGECEFSVLDDRMIERSYGIVEGMRHEEFKRWIGEKIVELSGVEYGDLEQRNFAIDFFGGVEYDLIHRGYYAKVPGGESFFDVEKRVGEFIVWLKKFVKKNKCNVVISAHGNSIRLFRKIMEGASVEKMKKWNIPYDKVFVYSI